MTTFPLFGFVTCVGLCGKNVVQRFHQESGRMKSTLDKLLLLFFLVGIADTLYIILGSYSSVSELYWEGTSFAEWLNLLTALSCVRAVSSALLASPCYHRYADISPLHGAFLLVFCTACSALVCRDLDLPAPSEGVNRDTHKCVSH